MTEKNIFAYKLFLSLKWISCIYILIGAADNIALNNFFLHVLNHALKIVLTEVFIELIVNVLIDLINYGIHFLIKKNIL